MQAHILEPDSEVSRVATMDQEQLQILGRDILRKNTLYSRTGTGLLWSFTVPLSYVLHKFLYCLLTKTTS